MSAPQQNRTANVPAPMLATLGEPPVGPGWAVELKWDGVRGVVAVVGGEVSITSRTGRDVTSSYPEVVAALRAIGRDMVLDGELVAMDAAGRPGFGLLQQRMHVTQPSRELVAGVPVVLQCFDVLSDGGRPVTSWSYAYRRELLSTRDLARPALAVPPSWSDVTPTQLLTAATEQGLEGVVAKRLTSTYLPGRRSRDWVKTPVRRTTEVLVCGWTAGQGSRSATFGALLLGAHDGAGRLVYLGNVGTGFTEAAARSLLGRLTSLARSTSPFGTPLPPAVTRSAHWVDPVLVGDVEYREVTGEGRLRHPSWRGLRSDKEPSDVTRVAPPSHQRGR